MTNTVIKTPSSSDINLPRSKTLYILLAVAFGLRLVWLGSKSLWLDEANALRIVDMGQAALWAGRSELYHPPLFYWLLEYWLKVGHGEFMLRLPGVVFGSLSIIAVYVLAKDLLGQSVALSAVAIATFSPLLVWYSQDMRPYALLCLLGLLVIGASVKLCFQPKIGWWLVFVFSMATALYLHYFAILLLPVQLILLVVLLALNKTKLSVFGWIIFGWSLVVLIYWPWLQTPAATKFLNLVVTGNNDIFHALADRLNIVVDMAAFTNGYFLGGLLFFSAIGLFLLYRLLQMGWVVVFLQSLPSRKWAYGGVIILFLSLLALSVMPRGYTLKRQLVILWPYAIIFFAWFWPWQKNHYKLLFSLLLVSLIGSLINIILIPKPQWRDVTAFITENYQENDLVVLEPNYYVVPYDFYDKKNTNREGVGFNLAQPQLTTLLSQYTRIWLVVHGTDPHAQNRAKQWLDEQAILVDAIDYFRLQVRLYQRVDK